MFQIDLTINPSDLEPGYNHVNHALSLTFMEKGRLAFLESIGFPNEQFYKNGLFLVVTDIQVRYLRELFAETVVITVDSAEVDGKDLVLAQRILNKKNKECVTAIITFRFVDGAKKRSISVPEEFFIASSKALKG